LEIVALVRPYQSIGGQQMILQPWSHSLLGTAALALLLAGLAFVAYRQRGVAAAVLLATLGHFALDYLVHDADLTLWPAVDAARIGPAFVLDASQPTRGLFSTAPGIGFVLQSAVVAWGAVAFARAFPQTRARGRLVLALGMSALVLASLPVFIRGAMTGVITSTQDLLLAALAEIAFGALVIVRLCRFNSPQAMPGFVSLSMSDGPATVTFVKNLLVTAGTLCFFVAALYAGQGMQDAQRLPSVGSSSTLLAAAYAATGMRLISKRPGTLWTAAFLGLMVGPMVRILYSPGSYAMGLAALEFSLGVMSAALVRTLLRRDLLL
jgi:hypothetical protein